MIIYALIGVFFFRGAIENRCRTTPNPENDVWHINYDVENLCGSYECPNKLNNLFCLNINNNIVLIVETQLFMVWRKIKQNMNGMTRFFMELSISTIY